MTRHRVLLGAALITLAAARPASAQRIQDWQNRWYWGAKGGVLGYQMPTAGNRIVPQVGAEWLITLRRVALYIGYSSTFTAETDTFAVAGLTGAARGVTFDGVQRIQIDVITMIGDKAFQPYVGGGFVLETLSNAHSTAAAPSTTDATAITTAASGGFLSIMAGAQWRIGRKAAIYAHYQYSPQGRAFLLTGGANSLEAGLRYAFLSAKEADPTRPQ